LLHLTKQADTGCHIPLPSPRLLYSDPSVRSIGRSLRTTQEPPNIVSRPLRQPHQIYLLRTNTDIKYDYHTSISIPTFTFAYIGHRRAPFIVVERDVYVVGGSASSEVYRLGKPRSILRGVCVWSDLEIGARLGVLIISFLYASICASSTITTIMMVVDPNLLLFGMNIIPEWKRRHGRSRWFVAGWQCS
jgi:hypothetical protein